MRTPRFSGIFRAGPIFFALVLGLLPARVASAHDPGLSGLAVTVRADHVEAVATFSRVDIAALLAPGSDTQPSLELLRQTAPDVLSITDGSTKVLPDRIDVDPLARNNDVEFRLLYPTAHASTAAKWSLRSNLIERLALGHREYYSLQDAAGQVRAELLLQASAETVTFSPIAPSAAAAAASPPAAGHMFVALVLMGMNHILTGIDHLLFVLGLVLIVRDRWSLLKTITAFTIAHSITLAIATLGYATPPTAVVNVAIALSIFFLGPEILRAHRGGTSFTLRRPWIVAFAFGLLHGFGFATGLVELGIPRVQIPLALLSFNLGVEAGQLVFVLLILGLQRAFRQLEIHWARWTADLPAYTVGLLGAFWTLQRAWMLFAPAR